MPSMSIARNFFLGRELVRRVGPFTLFDQAAMDTGAASALGEIGIHIRNARESVARLSGGERQSISIARALHFGTRVLILDEPTSALSVGETRKVLGYIAAAIESTHAAWVLFAGPAPGVGPCDGPAATAVRVRRLTLPSRPASGAGRTGWPIRALRLEAKLRCRSIRLIGPHGPLKGLVVLVHQLEVRVLVPGLATKGVQDFHGSPHQRLGFLDPVSGL